jgi:dTDP-4-dehydrorhamnose 3,5-epimerase
MSNMTLHIESTAIPDVQIITPSVFFDQRGFFCESYQQQAFDQVGISSNFLQDNHSRSCRGVIRGLHYQLQNPQGKLVTSVRGEIFDVAVDIRQSSATFGQWVGVILSDENHKQLWIPPGFAHGFAVLSEYADVVYKCTELWDPMSDRCIHWNDRSIGIRWPLPAHITPIVSAKDQQGVFLVDAEVFS